MENNRNWYAVLRDNEDGDPTVDPICVAVYIAGEDF